MFLRNFWYVAAWPSEIGEKPLARTICGEEIAFYRTGDNKVVALEDRCCHRNLPLTMGKVEGDNLRCGYHGLLFDKSGQCVEVPGQSQIPPGARVKSYPLVEKWKLLWIWMGDPAKADEKTIPDWYYMDHPDWVAAHGNDEKPLYMRCNWELNNDNLLDLMHVVYVHPATLGGAGLDNNPVTTTRLQNSVRMMRWSSDVEPVPLLAKLAGFNGTVSDRWQATTCELPSHCTIDAGFAEAGKVDRDGDWDQGVRLRALITATPETETTSFMFYAQCRNFARGDEEVSQRFIKQIRAIFDQDIAVMEGQQRINSALPNAATVEIRCDVPVVAMRRLVLQAAAEERGAPMAPQPVPATQPIEAGPLSR